MGNSALLRLLLACIVFVAPSTLMADVRVANLYETEVRVTSESFQARKDAQIKGLMQIFTRISGKVDIGSNPRIKAAVKDYTLYIRQFKYIRKGDEDNARVYMWVSVNEELVNKVLRSADLPVWGERRPHTVVWVAIDDGRRRYMLSSDAANDAKPVMEQNAKRRGTPLLFPLMDLEDRGKVRFTDIWGGFISPIKTASERYPTEAILIARVSRRGNGWFARWTFLTKGNRYNWTSSGQHQSLVLAIGIDGAADKLAVHYAKSSRYAGKAKTDNGQQNNTVVKTPSKQTDNNNQQNGNANNTQKRTVRSDTGVSVSASAFLSSNPPVSRRRTGFYMSVANMKALNDYVAIGRYLVKLSAVRSAKIVKLDADRAVFEVIPRNSASNVKQAINIGNTLIPVSGSSINLDPTQQNSNPDQREFANIVRYRYAK